MSTRKKWWTRQRGTAGFLRWPSKTAAYDHVIDRRDSWRPGSGDSATLYVYVDEGNGRELFETIDLSAGPAAESTLS